MTLTKEILLILILSMSLVIALLSWNYFDYFLSRKDRYVNNRYKLLIKKLGWFVTAFFTSLLVLTEVFKVLLKNI